MQKNLVYHKSVLINEVISYLAPKQGGVYVDATFGGGGHTQAILNAAADSKVIAIDWDAQALEMNGEPLKERYQNRIQLIWGNFAHLDRLLKKENVARVDGILADFGTSQYQLLERAGFSFHHDTPLDMRMSPAHQKITAADILNKATQEELILIFKEYGQEPKARAVAKEIVCTRKERQYKTTQDLVKTIERALGPKRGQRIHPATKIFQALRITVNHELDNIKSFLHASLRVLTSGGRLVCISFHSLEDRLVKEFFKKLADSRSGTILTPKLVIPTQEETYENPAARSARLRALEVF